MVVTKDADFVDSHLLRGCPAKLLFISTGNISNLDLEALTVPLIPDIVREFQTHSFLELGRMGIVIRTWAWECERAAAWSDRGSDSGTPEQRFDYPQVGRYDLVLRRLRKYL